MNMMPHTMVTPAKPRVFAGRAVKIVAHDVNVYYADKHAIKHLSIDIPDRAVSSFIGPSGCGKSTFLRAINRMNDTIPIARMTGEILIDGKNVYDRDLDVVQLRARVGMVFRSPTRFPSRSSRMSPTAPAFTAFPGARPIWRRSSSTA